MFDGYCAPYKDDCYESGSIIGCLNQSLGESAMVTGTPFLYTGRDYDSDTELYYYRARWYDPQARRFLSEDPIGLDGGINLYAYVENNPINNTDPSGLLVSAVYYHATGRFVVTDDDTGKTASMMARSGGIPTGDPIPRGWYEILYHPNPNSFRLDAMDSMPRNDINDDAGRDLFRLHSRGNGATIGCIGAEDDNEWVKVRDLILNTRTITVPENLKQQWWKVWRKRNIIKYGTLVVFHGDFRK